MARALRLGRADGAVRADGLGDLVANRPCRIEAGGRVLEDHRDFVAAHVPQLLIVEPDDFASVDADAAADAALAGQQAHDGVGKRALAAAAFTDDAEDLAALRARATPIDRRRWLHRSPSEADADIGEGEDRRSFGHPRGIEMRRSPSPRKVKASTATTIARPGNISTHGAWISTSRPSASMPPSDGVGGCVPRPRKLRPASSCKREGAEHRGLHDDRAERVRRDMSRRAPAGGSPLGRAPGDIVVAADDQRARAHHARQDRQVDDGNGDGRDDAARPENGDEGDREQHGREDEDHVEAARDGGVDPAAEIAGQQPERHGERERGRTADTETSRLTRRP